jgi:hypothetical protein
VSSSRFGFMLGTLCLLFKKHICVIGDCFHYERYSFITRWVRLLCVKIFFSFFPCQWSMQREPQPSELM